MITEYYLDESGSSGDLARAGNRFDFGRQEIFTLACLGVDQADDLGSEIDRLKAIHFVQADELKSSSVRDRPRFVGDLVQYVARRQLPLMIEVVDKRFMIAAKIINTLVLPPLGPDDRSPEALWLRNVLAEYLHTRAPAAVFEAYVSACDGPSTTSIEGAFTTLLEWLRHGGPADELGEGLLRFAEDSYADFQELEPDNHEWIRRSLPSPDLGKRGQSVWMLPNLTSLTNIYARLNHMHRRRIGTITLLHDEQAHFDHILREAKRAAEGLVKLGGVPIVPFADYHFEEAAALVFTGSHASPGIQAADVLAGFLMRYTRELLYAGQRPSTHAREVFHRIIDLSEPNNGRGVNFVLATDDLLKLGVVPA
ncbi:DUF3800 domain-containing protein [Mesorhizobium temperatum]|uniref:DUF3800 domain-containing protein n=1 Tax=Mesorhizobium temperatum TaxID=241416 RepID=A0A271LHG1_9HYPH|nr:DUF3800 domain-containing protein [Mesorhizobium temperatum]PAQ06726.1 hypothetical protein CIT26_24410 [Mesorhizobium temperatum]